MRGLWNRLRPLLSLAVNFFCLYSFLPTVTFSPVNPSISVLFIGLLSTLVYGLCQGWNIGSTLNHLPNRGSSCLNSVVQLFPPPLTSLSFSEPWQPYLKLLDGFKIAYFNELCCVFPPMKNKKNTSHSQCFNVVSMRYLVIWNYC